MQILKDDVRQNILNAAIKVFYDKGFEHTTMRSIAVGAGFTVGNIYRYYKNKGQLFTAVVNPVIEKLKKLIATHDDGYTGENLMQILTARAGDIAELLTDHRKQLLILIDGSRNTEYEKTGEFLVETLARDTLEHLRAFYKKEPGALLQNLARAVAASFFEGYWNIIRNNIDKEVIYYLVGEYTTLTFAGWKSFV